MKRNRNYLWFITPGFIFYTIFVIFPIIYIGYLSFTDWSGMGDVNFVGVRNFVSIFNDERFSPIFFNAVKNNLKYLLCVWLIVTPIQYFIAYMFYIKIPAYKYTKFMIFLPYVISTAVVSFFATLIFDPNIGMLNNLLENLGIEKGAWFGDPNWAFKLMLVLIIWQGAGSGIMIFYSNFISMSKEVMEASRVDGCTEWQRFVHVLLPMSLPSCASVISMSTIWALAIFDFPFILGGSGGGVSGSLDFVNLVFYRYTFGSGLNGKSDLGFGAAICVVMFILMFVITFAQSKVLKKFDYDN